MRLKFYFFSGLALILTSGCNGTIDLAAIGKGIILAEKPIANIIVTQDISSSQETYTSLSPSLNVKFVDELGESKTAPSDLSIELVGTGTLSGTDLLANGDGSYRLANLKVDSIGTNKKIKLSSGDLAAESSNFNVTTRSLSYSVSQAANTIDPDSTVFENTYTVNNLAELRALVYKRVDTNGDGVINTSDSYRWNALPPSTKVILGNGDWSNVGKMYIGGMGQPGRPIVFEAQSRGGVTFKGTTEIYLFGSYVSMKGMQFVGVKPTVTTVGSTNTMAQVIVALGRTNTSNSISLDGLVVPTGGAPLKCDHCSLRYNKFDNSAQTFSSAQTNPFEEFDMVWTSGTYNEISNNTLQGMNNPGHFIIVWRVDGTVDYHKIFKNEFLDQVFASGANGNEVIRIGTGADTYTSSNSLVEQNLFENVDGEIETVSIKSWDNTIRFNTFRNNKGSICIRSAGRALVEGNYILGMLKSGSGGVRAINTDNMIVGNHIQDTTPASLGDMTKNAGIVLPKGTDNPASNYYFPVVNTKIAFNMFANNSMTFYFGADAATTVTNDTIDPVNVGVYSNVIKGKTNEPIMDRLSPLTSFNFAKNYMTGGLLDSSRTTDQDIPTGLMETFAIQSNTWNLVDRVEDPMREKLRVTTEALTEAGFSSSQISRMSMVGATIYEVHLPLNRGEVGCGY